MKMTDIKNKNCAVFSLWGYIVGEPWETLKLSPKHCQNNILGGKLHGFIWTGDTPKMNANLNHIMYIHISH